MRGECCNADVRRGKPSPPMTTLFGGPALCHNCTPNACMDNSGDMSLLYDTHENTACSMAEDVGFNEVFPGTDFVDAHSPFAPSPLSDIEGNYVESDMDDFCDTTSNVETTCSIRINKRKINTTKHLTSDAAIFAAMTTKVCKRENQHHTDMCKNSNTKYKMYAYFIYCLMHYNLPCCVGLPVSK